MPFVTKLRLTSGDRGALDRVVDDIKTTAARKGVEFNGPHPAPPAERRVPQSKGLSAYGGRFEDWTYTVYARSIEIVGHDEFARSVASEFPAGIHAEVEIERVRSAGSG
ncbi:uS10/mL48 family ribosomal protein [Halococcus saccharolyticus]|uniref:Small ribosomal subunit protein uS10 n=1 Tax=Halococcus saccharolyticus DSM 5350 TaxID=1227455 RepID=M0MHQ2_9EURY|nr:uS10/mL48 family ribosomal protein [Halococcus saccharolyticus]EMA44234.1 30S ribosomal protein S10 [Halococcus saccharolyticus DSM 5350]